MTFEDSGLAAGRPWSVSVLASNGTLAGNFTTSAQSDSIDLAVGSYTYSASPPTGWSFAPRHPTSFTVSGQRTITVPFAIAGGYNYIVFTVHYLGRGVAWSVTLNWSGASTTGTPPDLNATESTTGTSLRFATWTGATYCFTVNHVADWSGPSVATGCFNAGEIHHISTRFWGPLYTLTFTEVGLTNQSWTVNFWGTPYTSNGSTPISVPGVVRGTGYYFRVVAPVGFQASPSLLYNIKVKAPSTWVITFTPTSG